MTEVCVVPTVILLSNIAVCPAVTFNCVPTG